MSRPPAILSFNILRDRRDEPAWAWERRRALVIEVVRDQRPDVIAFQEVAPDMRADLARRLPEYAWTPRPRDHAHGRPLYVGDVAYRARDLVLTDHDLVVCEPEQAGDDGWPLARWPAIYGGTWARLRWTTAPQPALVVWSVHLPHQSAPLRHWYADRLLGAWASVRDSGTAFIVAGDFNEQPGGALHQRLTTDTGLGDARVQEGERVLDWILLGRPVEPIDRQVIDLARDGVRASDHPALCARLRLSDAAEEPQTPGDAHSANRSTPKRSER